MSSNVDDGAVAGPSHEGDQEESSSSSSQGLATRRRVQFDRDVEEEEEKKGPERAPRKRADSQARFRRQSVMGKAGFVTQLLEEHLEEEEEHEAAAKPPEEEPGRKPIRKQTLDERRESVKAIEADVSYYMKEAARKSRASVTVRSSASDVKLVPTMTSAEKLEELQNLSKLQLDETLPSSGWKPSHILQEEQIGIQQERSWVGTYIVGKDYWSNEEQETDERSKEVPFSIDDRRKSWYEMPLEETPRDPGLKTLKHRSLSKIEFLKDEMDEKYEEKRKQRMIAAAQAREEHKTEDVWSEEFKDHFRDVSRSSEFSHRGSHLSMVDADEWLEKAEILDHGQVTLVHTGFCFLASGGSRHRGLSFGEFTQFLQLISITAGIPLAEIVRRMIACRRGPVHLTVLERKTVLK